VKSRDGVRKFSFLGWDLLQVSVSVRKKLREENWAFETEVHTGPFCYLGLCRMEWPEVQKREKFAWLLTSSMAQLKNRREVLL